eukprot:TRINITY_DN7024_c0_g1_i3.p1 TRINITY_DN7024_c0_g1~~TRINITY_DN7024_c0_g1_i3.p1  ORF type:complete len:437 (+),score=80.55 TRINITY_DN7024_c0_g1_i3:197-1507(+)
MPDSCTMAEVPQENSGLITGKIDKADHYGAADSDHAEVPVEDQDGKVSTSVAVVLMVKSMIGIGWMSMPKAFGESGLMLGVLLGLFVGWLTAYGLVLMIRIYLIERKHQEELTKEEHGTSEPAETITFQKLASLKLGDTGDTVVVIAMLISQIGVLVAYLVYFGQYGGDLIGIPHWAGTLALAPVCVLLSQLRTVDTFKDLATIGVVFVLIMMLFVVGYSADRIDGHDHNVQTHKYTNGPGFPTFFGIAFFSMEGIFCYLPIVQAMRTPEDAPASAAGAVSLTVFMYMMVGLIGYLAYGDHVKAPITENMPNDALCLSFRGLQAASLLLTFPLIMFPVSEYADQKFPDYPRLTRLITTLFIVGLALAFPKMADILSIVGGLGMTTAGVVVPILMWSVAQGGWHTLSLGRQIFYASVMGVTMILGIWASILSAVDLL